MTPWLDYDPGSMDHVIHRSEYKQLMLNAVRALKSSHPDILCVGCIETDWVTIDPSRIMGGDKLPRASGGPSGPVTLTPDQTRIIDAASLPWKDSYKRTADGDLVLELYTRGGKPQTAISVYPEIGNYQHSFLLGQLRFLIDEVGMDGFYIDQFSQAWAGSTRTYDGRWDGVSVDIDLRTGRIRNKFVDCSLAGIPARLELCQYALSRGKIVIANTYATSMPEQSLPVYRFSETCWVFDPMSWEDSTKPPAVSRMFQGHLGSPIGLGVLAGPSKQDLARRIMKGVVTYLRNGLVYYHYACPDPPMMGKGSGDFGPVNHMFPITPLELGEGWIIGKERILAATSLDTLWEKRGKPVVRVFDLRGRALNADDRCNVRREKGKWRVLLSLRDWQEIAVVE